MRVRHDKRIPSWAIGAVMVVLIAVGSVLAYTKQLPFGDHYEVKAVFSSAQNIRTGVPVRIAGIDVGEVVGVEHLASPGPELAAQAGDEPPAGAGVRGQEAAVITLRIADSGRPIRTDATIKLRPRLFLEGNLFVDLQPGSPSAPEAEHGFTFPINQTSNSVELDQILSTLQADVRSDLQILLNQLGNALIKYGGADGLRELYRTSPPMFRYTSQVNEALLGREHGDLRGMLRGMSRVFRGLARNEEALKDLVTNFRIFTGSFARQDQALGEAIEELPRVLEASRPAYANLNASFPALRAFAREALPGVETTPETIEAATPFIRQVRLLVSERELRGLVRDLRPTIRPLARLARQTRNFLQQSRALSSCFNEVVIRWANDTVKPGPGYPFEVPGRVFELTGYGLSGVSGENRSGDANANYLRVHGSGGTNMIQAPDTFGFGHDLIGLTPAPLLGAMPGVGDSAKTEFRPGPLRRPDRGAVRCETQEPPNLEGGVADLGITQQPAAAGAGALSSDERRLQRRLQELAGEAASAGEENAPQRALRGVRRELERLFAPEQDEANRRANSRNRDSGSRNGGGER